MNNNGNFHGGTPAALMSYPFPMYAQPQQHPPLMEHPPMHPQASYFPCPQLNVHSPRFYPPAAGVQPPKAEKRKQDNITCDACGIEVNSQQMMDAHIRGQKHIKKMKLKAAGTSGAAPDGIAVDVKPPIPLLAALVPAVVNEAIPVAATVNPPPPPPSANTKSVLQSMNELAKFNKVATKYDLIKETGPAHCKQFDVRLTVADETYLGSGTSIKRAQQVAAEQALANTALKRPEQVQRASNVSRATRGLRPAGMHSNPRQPVAPRPMPSTAALDSTLDHLLHEKNVEISEHSSTISKLHQLVDSIERALKTVSDKMMKQCQANDMRVIPRLPDNVQLDNVEPVHEDPSESFRMLKGAMKVSTLAMRLLLRDEHEYTLVLICANKPNETLLNEICQELTLIFDTPAGDATLTYQVQALIPDGCLTVHCSLLPEHSIRVLLTSPVFRSENFLIDDHEACHTVAELNPDPADMLDKSRCLEAAAEIRHSNWFTGCMSEHVSITTVLRLLRHLQLHQRALAPLNLWCLVLLVHKCQIQPIRSVGQLFRAVFACLSSGILLPNAIGSHLIDPCEKDPVDAAAHLNGEQRIQLTAYAQDILRCIAFGHYEKIFVQQTATLEPSPTAAAV